MAKFVQIIEYRTSSPDDVMRLSEEWAEATRDRTTAVGGLTCIDRQDGHYYTLVEFPSFEAAMENSNMPETKAFAERIEELCDEPPKFHDLDVVFREPIGAAEMMPSEPRVVADCRDIPSDWLHPDDHGGPRSSKPPTACGQHPRPRGRSRAAPHDPRRPQGGGLAVEAGERATKVDQRPVASGPVVGRRSRNVSSALSRR
jgi:hypothetical protein